MSCWSAWTGGMITNQTSMCTWALTCMCVNIFQHFNTCLHWRWGSKKRVSRPRSTLPTVILHHTHSGKYPHPQWPQYLTVHGWMCTLVCVSMWHTLELCVSVCVCVKHPTLGSQQRPASVVEPCNRRPAGVGHTQGQPRSQTLPLRTSSFGKALQPAVCPTLSLSMVMCICVSVYA